MSPEERNRLASTAMYLVIGSSILGNFFSGWIARFIGYRRTIAWTFIAYFAFMLGAYIQPRDHTALLRWFPLIGFCQGVFALFTMYLPPLFPTLLRTTGAGFSYNIGRIAAAVGTVFFGLFSKIGDHRLALLYAGFLFVPAAFVSFLMPREKD
jgi:Na+/melibiose symporter-like transporter